MACNSYGSATPSAKTSAEQMEKAEFAEFIKQDSILKHQTASESLNILLNDGDPRKVSVMIKNSSNCDVIVRFAGAKSYNLPIRKNDKNFIVIDKGEYYLGANLCNSRYSDKKNFTDSVTLTLFDSK